MQGAHVASFFYAFLTALGVFMTVRLYRKDLALPPAVAFFVALPVTYYVIEAAFTQHIIAAALLAWTVYFYLSGRTRLSGLFMGLAGLTIGIPFALVIPFFFGAGKSERLRLLEGYVPVVLALAGGVFLMFGNHALSSINAFTGVINFYGLSQYLTAYANSILKWIPTAAIFVWFVAASVKVRAREEAVKVSAIFTLLLPFAVGYFYPFFFIWQGLLLIIYMFMRMEVGEPWKSTYSAGSQ
ncbi:hypothetical protein [Thermogymnomonas acidicola]|uniref:hypothetical protein n=1 Tax=Thermogymnomonas acidicola TaxID=399579 RepID=UPI0009462976|nr:hypothetical protein [Thermogymnomonas acidicola]